MKRKTSESKKHMTGSGQVRLQLTSMMDMFTIILVFLLKTYSTQGQLINPSDDLTLPTSLASKVPEMGLELTVSADWILVNGKPISRTSDALDMSGYIIPDLREELYRYAREAERMESLYGSRFTGRVTIQGDKNLPYRLLMKVMATCGQSRYPNMRLVVYRKDEL